jgi:SHS2 domain-containing protein
MLPAMERRHRFEEHIGEVELELEASTEEGVFTAALEAFGELVSTGEGGEPAEHQLDLDAGDPPLLLVDWLGELVFLAETDGFVADRVTRFEHAGGRLRATVAGHRSCDPRQLVKAVTLHRLELCEKGGGWHGRVVLDV